ncbi:MAG: SUMF1/EgtB/PvdO family nonheme iron enzyme, partial [candidate division KSB1 bacterium]|nr:SUMF1/EgtB/PvdO family nonheme iron enzyme [candidate division KSB1 bacterium]
VPIKHVGGGLMGPELLELSEVFFEQDAGRRRIELAKLDRRIFKSAEGLKQLLEQADIWQAHIWRFAQEHRDMGTRISVFDEKSDVELTETEGKHHEQTVMRLVFDEKSDVELTEKVLDAFIAAIGQESRPLDAVQFQNKIDTLARKLKMSPDKILAVLRVLFETTIKREPVLTLLKAPCSALLIGDAGVGKTTVMRMLTLNLFKQLEKDGTKTTPIPLFVRLDKIAEYMKEDQPLDQAQEALLTYICQHWKPDLSCKDDLTEPAIESCSQPIQLILDGLDEIPSAKLRLKLASVARNLVQSQPVPSQPRQVRGQSGLAHIIITSRPAAVNESLIRTLGFPEVRLLELTTKQIEQFVHNFLYIYHAKDRQAGTKDARAFLSALEVSEAAQEFAANPLYLTVMILMHKKHQVLPKRRIELYAEFYEMLLLQRATGPALGKLAEKPVFEVPLPKEKPLTWGEDVYTPLLQRIAFITHSDDQDSVSISAERVVEAIEQQELQEEIKGIGIQDLARRFLDFADEHLGVLISRGPFYGFSHRSLQEYLAARRLSEFGESQQVKEFWTERALKKPDRWLEVARLLFCEIRKRDYLFKYLDGQWPRDIADTKDPRVIAMIGAILFDLEEFFKGGGGIRTLHQSVARALANRRDNSHHQPQLFLACGDALGLMDEPLIDVADPPMVYFEPKKPFNMGSEEYDNERPIHPVKLSPYWLGKYPVTNKEFAEFIKSGGYENEAYWYDEDSQWGFDAREFLRKELKEKAPRWWLDERFGKSRPLAPVASVGTRLWPIAAGGRLPMESSGRKVRN